MSESIPILPMKEALKFWHKKIPVTASAYRDLQEEYRIMAFTVAKLAQLDQITAVKKSLQRALKNGESFETWQKKSADIFIRAGWTGDTRYRLDTIFRTNIQTAYNAGRWKQAEKGKKDRPYAMYDAINDGRARPTHLAQDGKVYPIDSIFWRTWWPPNGFRCRCSVITLSEEDIKEGKLQVRDEAAGPNPKDPEAPKMAMRDIGLRPDSGFWANPGLTPFEIKLDQRYDTRLREAFYKDAEKYPLAALSKFLSKRDIENMQTLAWADGVRGREGYEQWAGDVIEDILGREQAKKSGKKVPKQKTSGQAYPVANLPTAVLGALRPDKQPRLSLVMVTHNRISHLYRFEKREGWEEALTKEEILSLPEQMRKGDTEWYQDRGNIRMIWKSKKGRWVAAVIGVDRKFSGGIANEIITAGKVKRRDVLGDVAGGVLRKIETKTP